jgi:uncharacterized phage protein gp47/JayE
MPFERPSLNEIRDRITADIERNLNIPPLQKRSVLDVIAKVNAGGFHLNYGYLDWILKQFFPDTAEAEYLARWASIWGVNRVEAAFSTGDILFTGTNGAVIPANSFLNSASGLEYRTLSDSTIVDGESLATVVATAAGVASNITEGSVLTLQSPVAGVDVTATVAEDDLTGGQDQETDDLLRERVLLRIQNPPIGGSAVDYEQRVLQIAGIGKAFVKSNYSGPGNVTIFILSNSDANPLPTEEKRLEVLAHITAKDFKPVPAQVSVAVPNSKAVNFNINPSPDTSAVKASIEANLKELIKRVREPGATLYLSQIREAISLATGESDHGLISPTADITCLPGEIPVFNSITWS